MLGCLFLCWVIISTVFLIITLESYEQHIAIIVALIIFIPFILLFPFYFVSFIILLITSGVRFIIREGRKLRYFLSITLGFYFIVWVVSSPFFRVTDGTTPTWIE